MALGGVQRWRVAQQPAPNSQRFQEMEMKRSDFKQPFHRSHGTGKNWGMNHCSQHVFKEVNIKKNHWALNGIIGSLGTKGDPLLELQPCFSLKWYHPHLAGRRNWFSQSMGRGVCKKRNSVRQWTVLLTQHNVLNL